MYNVLTGVENQKRIRDYLVGVFGTVRQLEDAAFIGVENEKGEIFSAFCFYDWYKNGSVTVSFAANEHSGCFGKGGLKFAATGFRYMFDMLKVQKALFYVQSTNEKSIKITKNLGCVLEYTIEKAGENGSDLLIFTLTREQSRIKL